MEFNQLSFFLHVQTIGVFAGQLRSRVIWLPNACL